MIAVDTNVLVYAHQESLPKHDAARRRLVDMAEASWPWALPVFCLGEFLRVVTHPKVFDLPFSPAEACEAVRRLLASPSVTVLCPGVRFPEFLCEAILEAHAVGNVVFDAQIVALLRESGVDRVLTEDRDFDRFAGLRIERIEP